jgi:hypothetical protein
VLLLEPSHSASPECSERFWAGVDQTASGVVLVLAGDELLGVFSTKERAYAYALRFGESTGRVCMLVPKLIDVPEWGNVPLH